MARRIEAQKVSLSAAAVAGSMGSVFMSLLSGLPVYVTTAKKVRQPTSRAATGAR